MPQLWNLFFLLLVGIIVVLTFVNFMLFFSMLKMYTEIFKHDVIQRRNQ